MSSPRPDGRDDSAQLEAALSYATRQIVAVFSYPAMRYGGSKVAGRARGGGPGTHGFAGRGEWDFAAGSVFGVRWWRLGPAAGELHRQLAAGNGGRLLSGYADSGAWLHGSLETWQPGVNDAQCYAAAEHPADLVPVEGSCGCGYWAYWTADGQIPPGSGTGWDVVGVVEGTGRTLIGEKGFRCSAARVVGLHLATDQLRDGSVYDYVSECWRTAIEAALEDRYQVPVDATLGRMLDRHPPTAGYGPAPDREQAAARYAEVARPVASYTRGGQVPGPGRGATTEEVLRYAGASGLLAALRPGSQPAAADPGWRPVTPADMYRGYHPAVPAPAVRDAAAAAAREKPPADPRVARAWLAARRAGFDAEDDR